MLELHAECTGDLPTDGTVEVRGIASGATALWKLPRTVIAPSGSEGAEQQPFSTFDLEPQALVENLRLRVRLGDAVTDAVDITVVVRPIIELHWRVDRSATGAQDPPVIPDGARQFAVRAGSKVALDVECLNKPLKSVTLALPSGATAFEKQTVNSRALWKLPAGTALDNVAEPLAYEIDAIDEDGLSPVPRITGQIRLRADRPPRVAAAVISKKVLPTAKPRISYGAVDDYGIALVRVVVEITTAQGASRRAERRIWKPKPGETVQTTVRGDVALDLSTYGLAKGDQVQITVEADDERSPAPSQTGASEPITLEITDRNGILAGLLETDQQSAKQLDAIILRELGIGGGKK
jgi:hypothetical protein